MHDLCHVTFYLHGLIQAILEDGMLDNAKARGQHLMQAHNPCHLFSVRSVFRMFLSSFADHSAVAYSERTCN